MVHSISANNHNKTKFWTVLWARKYSMIVRVRNIVTNYIPKFIFAVLDV